eukprot:5447175-Pleurochrysis_carterae.AAC.1
MGEVNNPNGLLGLYDHVPRMYSRVTRMYPLDQPVRQSSLGTWYSFDSEPFQSLVSPIPPYVRRLKGL